MDIITNTTKAVDHNRWTVIAVVLATIIGSAILAVPGCQSKAIGLKGQSVTSVELQQEAETAQADFQLRRNAIEAQIADLNAEIEAANAKLQNSYAEIDRQDAVKAKILEFATTFGGGLLTGNASVADTVPAALTLGSLLVTGGVIADNKRKDIVIKQKKISDGENNTTA